MSAAASSASLPPPPPPLPPPAPPMPVNGFFSSRPMTTTATGRNQANPTNSLPESVPETREKEVKSSRIQTLTAQLNLAECLSAGRHQMAQRGRIMSASTGGTSTDSSSSNSNERRMNLSSPPPSQRNQAPTLPLQPSPYRYNQLMCNVTIRPTATVNVNAANKRTVASQTDIDASKLVKNAARKKKKHVDANSGLREDFNLYGLDTDEEQSSSGQQRTPNAAEVAVFDNDDNQELILTSLPSPPAEFRNQPMPAHNQPTHLLNNQTIPGSIHGLNINDRQKTWNSLRPLQVGQQLQVK